MSQLLVTLNPPGSPETDVAYALLSSAGAISQGCTSAALLPKADATLLVLPAQALAWHRVQLPKLPRGISAQKMQAVLAGVLEEQLLDEPSQLHMALWHHASEEDKDSAWVAVCNKAWLQQAITQLQGAGLALASILPQVFPGASARLHASGSSPEQALLHYSDAQGVVSLPLQHARLLPALEDDVPITAEPAVAAAAENALQQRVSVMQAAQWAAQAAQAAQEQGIDLAQGDMVVSGGGRWLQRLRQGLSDLLAAPRYKPLRWGAAVLLLAHVAGLNAWAWKEKNQAQAKRAQMQQLLTQSFPQVKVVVDAPVQMQRELVQLRQAQGQLSGRDFESIYARFSALAPVKSTPFAINYIANEVSLRGVDMPSSQIESLQPRLQYTGLAVRQDAQQLIISHRDTTGAAK
jgi:general secretion pathway protein L